MAARKPRHVVDDAAAESDHHAGAVGAALAPSRSASCFEGREALLLFAARKEEHFVRDAREAGGKLRPCVAPDILGGDDEDLPGLGRNVLRGPPDHAALHDGGIAALRRYDLVSWHTPFYHAVSRSFTTQDQASSSRGDVGMAVLAGNGGGRSAVVRRVGGVGAGLQEQGDDFAVPGAGGGVQRRHAVGLLEVGVRAALQQKGGQRTVSGGDGGMQRGDAQGVARGAFRVGAGVEQQQRDIAVAEVSWRGRER